MKDLLHRSGEHFGLRSIAGVLAVLGGVVLASADTYAASVVTNGNIYHSYGYTLKADGSSSGIAKYTGATSYDNHLSFAPDGNRMVFHTQLGAGNPLQIVTANANYTNRKTIVTASTYGFNNALAPEWSPNGKLIAFVFTSSALSRISVVDSSGAGLKQLTNTSDIHISSASVTWYPDSNRLMYLNKSNQLCTVSVSSTQKTCSALPANGNVGNKFIGYSNPKLSPDGKYVAITLHQMIDGTSSSRADIVRTSPTGTGYVNLTAGSDIVKSTNHVWSPDSNLVAFYTGSTPDNLGIISTNGTQMKRIATPNGSSIGWQPKLVTVETPSNLTVTRNRYCGNNGGYYSWLDLKATWRAQPKTIVASYRIYENDKLIKSISNTRLSNGTISTNVNSSQWAANTSATLKYTVKGVDVNGVETGPSNTITIYSSAYDC